jgi:hypothetical protein
MSVDVSTSCPFFTYRANHSASIFARHDLEALARLKGSELAKCHFVFGHSSCKT